MTLSDVLPARKYWALPLPAEPPLLFVAAHLERTPHGAKVLTMKTSKILPALGAVAVLSWYGAADVVALDNLRGFFTPNGYKPAPHDEIIVAASGFSMALGGQATDDE